MIERHWNAPLIANILGAIFPIVGIVGFIPNPLISPDGVFHVNAAHNFVHIITGLIFFAGAYSGAPVMTIRWIAVIYAIIAVFGIIWPNRAIAGVEMNWADNWLHVVLAIVMLVIGFTAPTRERVGHAPM